MFHEDAAIISMRYRIAVIVYAMLPLVVTSVMYSLVSKEIFIV